MLGDNIEIQAGSDPLSGFPIEQVDVFRRCRQPHGFRRSRLQVHAGQAGGEDGFRLAQKTVQQRVGAERLGGAAPDGRPNLPVASETGANGRIGGPATRRPSGGTAVGRPADAPSFELPDRSPGRRRGGMENRARTGPGSGEPPRTPASLYAALPCPAGSAPGPRPVLLAFDKYLRGSARHARGGGEPPRRSSSRDFPATGDWRAAPAAPGPTGGAAARPWRRAGAPPVRLALTAILWNRRPRPTRGADRR